LTFYVTGSGRLGLGQPSPGRLLEWFDV